MNLIDFDQAVKTMNDRRKVFLARNSKTNFHSLFEVVPSGSVDKVSGVLDMDTMNALVQWKNLDELVSVLERTGPVILADVYKEAKRLVPIADAVEIAEAYGHGRASQGFGFNDESFLRMQLYLDGCEGFYPSKASVARGISNHGLLESGAVDDLRAWAKEDPGAMVAIEPIADIGYIRNLCSICLRLIANCQNPDVNAVLEASGFKHAERKHRWWITGDYRDTYYVIPFHHNTADDMTLNFSWKWGKNVFAYMVIDPLNQLVYGLRTEMKSRKLGSVGNAVTLAPPVLTGKGRPFINLGFDYENEDTRIYLGIEDDIPQAEAAERFVYGVARMFSKLKTKKGEPLGWDFDELPSLSSNDCPEPTFHSLASAMVGTLMYRMERLPVTCKNCGNGMLIRPKGKRREFCSDSCRSQFSAGNASGNG